LAVRKVLLISYIFPPVGGIGVQRALSMARYLPENDLEVHVLTASNPAAPIYDQNLVKLIPAHVKVHTAMTAEPPFYLRKKVWDLLGGGKKKASRQPEGETPKAIGSPSLLGRLKAIPQRILCPDPQVLWAPMAIRKAKRVIKNYGIDAVLVTAPPFSVFLISNEIKRTFPHVKLVSDFRDEWLRFYLTDFDFLKTEYTVQRATQIERDTVTLSDTVVAVTQGSLNEIRSRYPNEPDSKFVMIPNGYDPAAFSGVESRKHGQPGRMIVTHTGTAYHTASPKFYLDAVDRLPDKIRASMETRFIGRVTETEAGIFSNRGHQINLLGFMPQKDALIHTAETDYLLLTMINNFSLPGKIFEYLAMRKPILALSPPGGEVDRLIQETRSGWCVPHEDPAAIARMLTHAWERLQKTPHEPEPAVDFNDEAIHGYERAGLARRMAGVLQG
jgi:Glycosyltransferase Family 4/Glycosyl transferases group 1